MPTTVTSISIALRPDQIERVKILADHEGLTVSCWVRRMLDKQLGRRSAVKKIAKAEGQ